MLVSSSGNTQGFPSIVACKCSLDENNMFFIDFEQAKCTVTARGPADHAARGHVGPWSQHMGPARGPVGPARGPVDPARGPVDPARVHPSYVC